MSTAQNERATSSKHDVLVNGRSSNVVENPNGFLLQVRKVHAQMVFTSPAESGLPVRGNAFILIDFVEAVHGLGLYCADLTDYVHSGDKVLATKIESCNDLYYAKSVVFNVDTEDHNSAATRNLPDYITGTGVVEHVGDYYAGIRADDRSVAPEWQEFLMPITALTRDSVPIGRQLGIVDVQLKDLVKPGDKIFYKVPRIPIDEGPRGRHQVASARKWNVDEAGGSSQGAAA